MAGLFDFKSAEDILKERQDTTRKNVMEAFNQPGQYKVRGERTANAVGKILGLLGGQLFADSPEEQVAGKMQRANQLAESLKPVEGESQSDFYNRVAASFNDAGYSQNSLRALTLAKQAEEAEAKEAQRLRERNELTEYQRRIIKLQEEKDKREAALYDLGGGTPAGGDASSEKKSYKPGQIIKDQKTGKEVVVDKDGSLVDKEVYDARKQVEEGGYSYEPSSLEKAYDFVTSPLAFFSEREILGQAQMVSKALETKEYRNRDLDAMRDLVKLPQEDSGLTIPEYNQAILVVKANSK